jgi:hypothetical protein
MPESIKAQILNRIMANFEPLKTSGDFRAITRERNLLLLAAVTPALQIYDGPERFVAKDTRGRTWHFDIGLKICLTEGRDLGAAKDTLVPKVQKVIETDLQLGGLADFVDGGEEIPYITETEKPAGGALILYTVQYRRVLGDPYTTY